MTIQHNNFKLPASAASIKGEYCVCAFTTLISAPALISVRTILTGVSRTGALVKCPGVYAGAGGGLGVGVCPGVGVVGGTGVWVRGSICSSVMVVGWGGGGNRV